MHLQPLPTKNVGILNPTGGLSCASLAKSSRIGTSPSFSVTSYCIIVVPTIPTPLILLNQSVICVKTDCSNQNNRFILLCKPLCHQ
jgi:hypothetical protein